MNISSLSLASTLSPPAPLVRGLGHGEANEFAQPRCVVARDLTRLDDRRQIVEQAG
jgi:hypothetical protein